MSSNFDQLFPQSGIRVLFLKQFPRRTRGETGVSIVARVETRLKQILREMDRSVMGRGSEVFRINPEELFQIIEDIIGNADASYEPRRQSERFGKTLLWLITDSDTGKQTMMFAEDYDEVLLKFAQDNDIEYPLDEEGRSNQKRVVAPGTSGLRRDPDYSRPAGGTRRPAKVLKK